MARLQTTAALAVLTIGFTAAVAIRAQQGPLVSIESNTAAEVTQDVLMRAGTAEDPLPGVWLSYRRTLGETRDNPRNQVDTAAPAASNGPAPEQRNY